MHANPVRCFTWKRADGGERYCVIVNIAAQQLHNSVSLEENLSVKTDIYNLSWKIHSKYDTVTPGLTRGHTE